MNERSIPTTIRISPEKREFLDENNISLSEIVNESLQQKMSSNKQEKKRFDIRFYSEQTLFIAIGIFILALSSTPRTFLAWVIMFNFGLFFVVLGIINLHQVWKHERRKRRL